MEDFLIYIIKSSGLTAVFLGVYLLLLKNDTGFKANRGFLLGGVVASFVLPLITFTRTVTIGGSNFTRDLAFSEGVVESAAQSGISIDWWNIAGIVYFGGLSLLLGRLILQLLSVRKYINGESKKRIGKLLFVTTTKEVQPFSFFNYIVYNPELHSAADLEIVLEHEKVHAHQWHSVDVILVNLSVIFLWCNPFIWMYKKHLIQNLEFLADKGGMENSVSKKAYQQTLLKISMANFQPALSNSFYQSFIKKRIIMLNKKSEQKHACWKMSATIPFLFIFVLSFQVETEAQVASEWKVSSVSYEESTEEASELDREFYDKIGAEPLFIIAGKEYNSDVHFEAGDINASQFGNKNSSDKGTVQQEEPLYVVNGKVQKMDFDVNSINPGDIASINVLKGDSATAKYGEKGKNGVIEITLKSEIETGNRVKKNEEKSFTFTATKIMIDENSGEKGTSFTMTGMSDMEFESSDALIVVNGKVQEKDYNLDQVKSENIESITVLKGKSATEKYGEKASKGVIEITLKN